MASINKHLNNGYRVAWYEDSKHRQKYFFGENARKSAQSLKKEMDQKFPNKNRHVRKNTKPPRSGKTGVCRTVSRKTNKNTGAVYESFYWGVSVERDSKGKKKKRNIHFSIKRFGDERAKELAFLCRDEYEDHITRNKMFMFWRKWNSDMVKRMAV
ncbi:MAG: hypothetical protein GY793_08980 [Proteobacteria bacterium]|nr:hypothetical protein [Pseudomonadota bacterium]